ncbi:sulfur-oxidizing protein SoxY [Marinospirillum celere]|uniref:Sulfur-oxidizing protein SoxY n=1 Tax=Marinospirillum celere TaxID=1122252 RepID=A0A1I1FN56_9GAMM|nr:thiosulfate oxidation carrier protein SoxY [Marinospirillum celere]SFB98533.1 sulfur-oxidizing protein SoxY [Marinospirillum celere]
MFNYLLRFFWVTSITLILSPLVLASSWQSFEPVKKFLDGSQPATSGLKLDLPLVSEDGSSVALEVSFEGQLKSGDQLESIHVFSTGNPNPEIIEFHFMDPRVLPKVATRVRLNETQTVIAVAKSREGATWVTEREVRVTVSGCLMRSDEDAEAGMQNPRIALPRRMSAGQALDVRTLINHPMETGLREDAQGKLIDQNLIEAFRLQLGGETVFRAGLHTGTAANPYIRVQLKLDTSTPAVFSWKDQQGQEVQEEREFQLR